MIDKMKDMVKDKMKQKNIESNAKENGAEEKFFNENSDYQLNNSEGQETIIEDSESDTREKLICEKDKLITEITDKWQRGLAEFDNFRKRTQKEKAVMYDDGIKDTIGKLLPVIDNFERALSAETITDTGFYKGVDMIFKQFNNILSELGVEELPGLNTTFDPNIHFAVTHVEDEKYGDNEVIEVLQKGYKYKDKIIRPSMVKVAN